MEDAWLAGIYEGEGSITQRRGTNTFQIRIKMTDYDVLERVLQIAGCGTLLAVRKYEDYHKQAYQWSIGSKKDITNVLSRILPFLGHRRAYKALNALDAYEL